MILENKNGLILIRQDQLSERNWRTDDTYKLSFSSFGETKYGIEGEEISLDKGEFLIFNPSVQHRQLKATKEKFLVEINSSLLYDVAKQIGGMTEPEFSFITYRQPQIEQWTSFVRNFLLASNDSDSNQLFLENSLTQLAILMLQYGIGSHQADFPRINCKENIQSVIHALKENYDEEWSLDQMAVIAQMGKYQFAHLFKEETGLSPYSWLQLYRLFSSQGKLIYTDQTILDIALDHGFKSVSSYNHLFKKVYRKTPRQFRLSHRIKQANQTRKNNN
ncbi:AraC family transcriptional regulator [Bacillus carboniphilus]|uniref:AraC family transcriptional regulator n=1 Tax=Bacillus carboniphilus TaxID=86663 RepID=A0ABY9JRS4_9BACI|nr:AraC family transcriptional regulator [Bacillus carboniphilus]WLR42111.1 AraC family transcriptional regulator [Bacillus carboniphilus]